MTRKSGEAVETASIDTIRRAFFEIEPELRQIEGVLMLLAILGEAWVTRILRLAFLDPVIVNGILAGKVTVALSSHALRHEGSVPALWAEQRSLHRIPPTI